MVMAFDLVTCLNFVMLLFILSLCILLVKGYIYFDKHAVLKKSTSFIYEYNHLVKWISLKQR